VQAIPSRKTKTRGNGQGTVYKRGDTWTACATVYDQRRRCKTKGGFQTKREAYAYAQVLRKQLLGTERATDNTTFSQLYERWFPYYEPRVGKTTMDGHRSAFAWFEPIHYRPFVMITAEDLQSCVDSCPRGKRTKENMKSLAMQLYKFAGAIQLCDKNYAQYIFCGNDKEGTREALSLEDIQKVREAARDGMPYADYVLCLIYTGFRPGEMLALKKENYDPEKRCFIGGGKTEAGTNRIVPVSAQIQPIIDRLVAAEGAYIFPRADGTRITDEYFRSRCFVPLMDALGIKGKVPYSCRHTFANFLKNISGSDTDKAKLMGHADASMTKYYQSADYESLRRIIDKI